LVAVIRRFDLDADAKLNFSEFADNIRPIETFNKGAVKSTLNHTKISSRPSTANKTASFRPISSIANS